MCSCGQTLVVNLAFLRQRFVGAMGRAIRDWSSAALSVFRDVVEQAGCLWVLIYGVRSELKGGRPLCSHTYRCKDPLSQVAILGERFMYAGILSARGHRLQRRMYNRENEVGEWIVRRLRYLVRTPNFSMTCDSDTRLDHGEFYW
jgi:hypothetical protein